MKSKILFVLLPIILLFSSCTENGDAKLVVPDRTEVTSPTSVSTFSLLPIPTAKTTTKLKVITTKTPVRSTFPRTSNPEAVKSSYSCGAKTKCGQMSSCAEARYYLDSCGLSRLDGDHDGIPCESLCN